MAPSKPSWFVAEVRVNLIWRWKCPESCGQVGLAVQKVDAFQHLGNHMQQHHWGVRGGEEVQCLHLYTYTGSNRFTAWR